MLDYDKKFLVKSWDNLTFDGSSIRGFTAQKESDLRLGIDWSAFYWGQPIVWRWQSHGLWRGHRQRWQSLLWRHARRAENVADDQFKKDGYTLNAANEIEGFLFKGVDAERHYHETGKFEYVNTGGYYHSLPGDALRTVHRQAPRKCSGPWVSKTKRTTRKSRPRSSKSTTAMPRSWPPPTRFSSTN